jgi:UPF0716 protein FxsA
MRLPLALIFLLLPLLEIAGFVLVGRQIGVLPTLGLVIATGVAGIILLRIQGFGVMSRIRTELEAGRNPSRELAHGVMIMAAGILLLIPGFFTDILGILLFLQPLRDFVWRQVRSRIRFAGVGTGGQSAGHRTARGKTIDLDEDDYSTERDPERPWRRIESD